MPSTLKTAAVILFWVVAAVFTVAAVLWVSEIVSSFVIIFSFFADVLALGSTHV